MDYSLSLPARCLASLPPREEQDTQQLLVGTVAPSLHLLAYDDDLQELSLEARYDHPTGEVWSLAAHPKNDTVVTCGGGCSTAAVAVDFTTTLWKRCHEEDEPRLESVGTVPHGTSGWDTRVGCILWSPLLSSQDAPLAGEDSDMSASLVTVGWETCSPISLWDLSASVAVETWSSTLPAGTTREPPNLSLALPRRASWDPHEPTHLLCTQQRHVMAYDVRCADGVGAIHNAHRYGVTDVDHNQLQEHVVVTSGLDGVVKFWDLRMHLSSKERSSPVNRKVIRGGHTHWATRASYNPFYDQLVLSAGTDGIANLWRVSSCSSAPLLDFDDDEMNNYSGPMEKEEMDEWANDEEDPMEETNNRTEVKPSSNDIRVERLECSDTTADVCWSLSDPWMYATLSCDGTVAVHHVPSKEKYKILL